jgi:site-specific DNA-methyltransferase (adenine-specific)
MDDLMELEKIYFENCLETMARMRDSFVDFVITSPPYDDIRSYNGYLFEFEKIARELKRVLKRGGVMIWVVGDKTEDGSKTGTSFRQALYFKEIGLNLHAP